MKSIGVMLSGGLDSTYVLFRALKEYQVVNLYILDMVEEKAKMARQNTAIQNTIDIVQEREFQVTHDIGCIGSIRTLKVHGTNNSSDEFCLGYSQPSLLIRSLLSFKTISSNDSILLGFVKGDHGERVLHHIQEAWSHLYKATFPDHTKIPTLEAPIVQYTKEQVIEDIPSSLLNQVTWCNGSVHEFDSTIHGCGRCKSCINMARAVSGIKYNNPSLYKRIHPNNPWLDDLIENTNKRNKNV